MSEISKNINEVNESVKSSSDNVTRVNVDLSRLAGLADNMQKIVNRFKISSNKKRIGDYLVDLKFISPEDLNEALMEQKKFGNKGKRLGDVLMEKKLVTKAQFEHAIELKMKSDAAS